MRDPFAPPANPPKLPPIIRHTVNTPAERTVNPFVRAKTPTAVSGASVNRSEPTPESFILLTELDLSAAALTDYSDDSGNTGTWSSLSPNYIVPTGTNEYACVYVQTVTPFNPDTSVYGPANLNLFVTYLSVNATTHVVKQTGLTILTPDLTDFFEGIPETDFINLVSMTYDNTIWVQIANRNEFSGEATADCICAIGLNDACTSVEGVWYPSPETYGSSTTSPKWLSSYPVSRNSLVLFANGSFISNYNITSGTTYASAYTSSVGELVEDAYRLGLDSIVIPEYTVPLGDYKIVIYAPDGEAPTIYTQTGEEPPNVTLTVPIIGGAGGFSATYFYIAGYSVDEGAITVSSEAYATDLDSAVAVGGFGYNYSLSTKAYFLVYVDSNYTIQEIGYSDVAPTVGPATSYPATGYAYIEFSTSPTLSQWESGDLPVLDVPTTPAETDSFLTFDYGSVDGEGNTLWVNGNYFWAGASAQSGGVTRSIGLASVASGSRVKKPSKKVHIPNPPTPIGVNRSSDPFLYPVT